MKTFKQYLNERKADHNTEKFKSWFGNSKVVDEDGNPQVCYHATPKDFDVFKVGGVDPKISGHAIWLTTNAKHQPANHNIKGRNGFKEGTQVLPVYVKITKPLIIDTKDMLEWAQEIFANGSKEFPQVLPKEWVDEVTHDGEYDGIIFKGDKIFKDGHSEIIVFKSNQIKSALGNNGDYSLDDDRIDR